jgi:hypothetical protein
LGKNDLAGGLVIFRMGLRTPAAIAPKMAAPNATAWPDAATRTGISITSA